MRCGRAIVSGGTSGIGLAIARDLVGRGLSTAVLGRDPGRLEEARRLLEEQAREAGGKPKVVALRCDVTRSPQVREAVRQALEALAGVEVVVAAAGVGSWGRLDDVSEAEWDRVLATNLKGAWLLARETLPVLRRQRGGYFISISSYAGKKGLAESGVYSASKFGMVGLTQSLYEEARADGVRTCSICPGMVDTPMAHDSRVPRPEMLRPEDIARAVRFLLDLSPVAVVREIVIERIGA